MLEFPRWVYRGQIDRRLVSSDSEYLDALQNGWRSGVVPDPEKLTSETSAVTDQDSPEEAINIDDLADELRSEYAPPTRAELEEKARELGIRFQNRTTDEMLALKIQDRLDLLGG